MTALTLKGDKMRLAPTYRIDDAAVPSYVRAAARRDKRPITCVVHLPGCWQLLTDADREVMVANSLQDCRPSRASQ